MKKRTGIMFVLLALMTGITHAQEKDKEVMIKKVFATLKNGDEDAYARLFPDAATTRNLLREILEKDTSKQVSKEMMEMIMAEITDEIMQKGIRDEFKRTMEQASDKGIDLAKATIVSYTADSAMKEDETLKAPMLSGKIYFTAGDTDCFMAFRDIIWIGDKGWYGVNVYRIDKKSRENEPEELLEEISMDTTNAALVDTVVAATPPPPAPKKKTTTKPPAKPPVKGKTTTPARKPEH